jgi:processive 1,2-diacylglycerol beta-glucosyltransferase
MEEYKPDLILSVNPCVVGSVRKSLKKMRSNVPLCTCIIDLVKHSRLWWDKKGAITFVPTKQMYDFLLKKGFARERLVHSGFPINEKFDKINRSPKTEIATPAVLMVSPSLKGNRASLRFVLAALRFNVNLTVVTGGNAGLKKYLDKKLAGIKNVSVCGYVFDMDKRLAAADVLVAKAGPNMILEAVKMCVPVLISGHILGQEEKNYRYITDNRYGLSCGSPKKLGRALALLFENDYKLLKEISHNQQSCPDTCGAKTVAERLVEALDK